MSDLAAGPRPGPTPRPGPNRLRTGTSAGARRSLWKDEVSAARAAFAHDHCVLLPGFFEPMFCAEVAAAIERARFHRREHGKVGSEACMEVNPALVRLLFALNDRRVFVAIDEITSCGAIGCFDGRVYRLGTSSADRDSWHDDLGDNRLAAMSVNVGGEYSGGTLQIRQARSGELLHEARSGCPGDALLFRIAPSLQHQVTSVQGPVARTVFAGWFKSRPSFRAVLGGEGWSAPA